MRDRVDHRDDRFALAQLAADLLHVRGVPARVAQQQVIQAAPAQPDRLGRSKAHDPLIGRVRRQDQLDQRQAADRFRGDPDPLPARSGDGLPNVGFQ